MDPGSQAGMTMADGFAQNSQPVIADFAVTPDNPSM